MERREFLEKAGAGLFGATTLGDEYKPPNPPEHKEKPGYSKGLDDVYISNEDGLYVYHNGDDAGSGSKGISELGIRHHKKGETDITGDVISNPKNPYSKTESDSPQMMATKDLDTDIGGPDGFDSYTIKRDYKYPENDLKVGIDWTVNVPKNVAPKGSFVIPEVEIKNLSNEEIRLDQDEADIHDGIQLFKNAGLNEYIRDDHSYQFRTAERAGQHFGEISGKFNPREETSFVMIFDDNWGATYGFLEGSTHPRMIVEKEDSIDYMVGEKYLEPGESAEYTGVIAIHEGGHRAPGIGNNLYHEAREMAESLENGKYHDDGKYEKDKGHYNNYEEDKGHHHDKKK